MVPQGSEASNTAYIDNLTAQVNALQGPNACAEIQAIVNQASASINAELASLRAQIAALLPVITIPSASPGAIVGWITSFVAPYETAYANFQAQLTAQLAAVGRLEAAIAAAAGRLTSCTVTIPPMT